MSQVAFDEGYGTPSHQEPGAVWAPMVNQSDNTSPRHAPDRHQVAIEQRPRSAKNEVSSTATRLRPPQPVVYRHLSLSNDGDSNTAVAVRLHRALHAYASTGLPKDWRLLKSLFFSACSSLPVAIIRPIRDGLVEKLLQQEPPRLEAVELLCMPPDRNTEYDRYEVQNYLMYYCTMHPDEALQTDEARKLLKGLQLCSISPEAEFLRPIVQTALNKGSPEAAHRLLETLSAEMVFPLSLPMVTDIIRGYGRQLKWTRVEELITWLHDQDISRKKPRGFAATVRHAFNLFACYNPSIEETYDFLTYCLQTCGMVPTSKLSRDVLSLLVRRRRYDLVHKWMKDRQIQFPGLANPVRAPATAHDIAAAWAARSTRQLAVSDILATCLSLARGAIRNEFSDEFRYVVKEAIEADISARCKKLCMAEGSATIFKKLPVPRYFKNFEALVEYVSDIFICIENNKSYHVLRKSTLSNTQMPLLRSSRRHARVALIRDELTRQLAAAYQTHMLLHDFDAYLKIYGPPVLNFSVPDPSESIAEPQEEKMISTFSEQWRYQSQTTSEILHDINAVYQDLEAKGEHIRRAIFFTAFVALINIERYRSVLALLHDLYISRWSNQVFNRQIYTLWVRTAMTVSNPLALREALWAIVDSPSSIELPARFLVLVRLAQQDLIYYHGLGWRNMTQEQHDEIEYLKKRIYRRKWYQMGCPDAVDIEEPHLREWAQGKIHATFYPMSNEVPATTEARIPKVQADEDATEPHTLGGDMVPASDHDMQLSIKSETKSTNNVSAESRAIAGSVNGIVDQQSVPLGDAYLASVPTSVSVPEEPRPEKPAETRSSIALTARHRFDQPSAALEDNAFVKGNEWPSSTDTRFETALDSAPGSQDHKRRMVRRVRPSDRDA